LKGDKYLGLLVLLCYFNHRI